MRTRAFIHLAAASVAAAGVFSFSVQLGHGSSVAEAAVRSGGVFSSAATSTPSGVPSTPGPSGTARRTDAEDALEQTLSRPAGTATLAPGETVVDESRPHRHVVDPRTGGLISVAGARGSIPKARDLGPMHADPLPAGVSLADPTDTRSLLERAGVLQAALAAAGRPVTAGATAPIGTPGIASLSAHVAPSCAGTGDDGKRVQVLYVHEASTPSRYADVLPVLRNEVANVDDVFAVSSEQTGGGRRVRWVHDADCLPVVQDVTVPDGALGPDFWGTVNALQALGFDDPNRKYLTFADANQFCGIGTLYNDLRQTDNYNDGYAASFARVDTNCWSTAHSVAAHELTHNLGGVQQGAPHATTNGHCWDDADLMCYDDGSGVPVQQVCAAAQEDLLDCNHDDYFNTDPAPGTFLADSWNTASSSFLDTVPVLATPPDVTVNAGVQSAQTGDSVRFTATSPKPVAWAWSTTSACALTDGSAAGTADLVCPSTVTGAVSVTATATDTASGAVGSGSASVTLTKALAPTVRVSAPDSAVNGTGFTVSASVTGKAPYTYAWTAGPCTVADATLSTATVTCPDGTESRQLPVTATVTQGDGQASQATSYVALTGSTGAPAPRTATSWTTPRAAKGVITATLSAGHTALSGLPVTLQVMWPGTSEWVDLQTMVTGSKGLATGDTGNRAGTFRFTYEGDESRAGSLSADEVVKPAKVPPGSSKEDLPLS